MLEEEAGH
jgi:hypothetical protein